jgi:hypothetical protein
VGEEAVARSVRMRPVSGLAAHVHASLFTGRTEDVRKMRGLPDGSISLPMCVQRSSIVFYLAARNPRRYGDAL